LYVWCSTDDVAPAEPWYETNIAASKESSSPSIM
jgi:hypothetical protein